MTGLTLTARLAFPFLVVRKDKSILPRRKRQRKGGPDVIESKWDDSTALLPCPSFRMDERSCDG